MRRISSRTNAVVEQFRDAARGRAPLMLLDGEHLVNDAVAAGTRITHLCVGVERPAGGSVELLMATAEAQGADVIEATAPVIDAISPVRSPSAIVALAERPDTATRLFAHAPALLVVACDIQDPGNLGAMIRVAEGAGATGVIVSGESADPYGWKALRGSMGSALRLPIERVPDVSEALRLVRSQGCRVVAAVPRGGTALYTMNLTGATAVLIGGEGRGLPPDVVDDADERLSIPMAAPVESLNAAVATALVVYEGRRQRS